MRERWQAILDKYQDDKDVMELLAWVATLEDKILVAADANDAEGALSHMQLTALRIRRGEPYSDNS